MSISAILLPPHSTNLADTRHFSWSSAKTLIIIPSPSTVRKVFFHTLTLPLSPLLILLQGSRSIYWCYSQEKCFRNSCLQRLVHLPREWTESYMHSENSSFGVLVSPNVPQIYPTSQNLFSATSWKWKHFILNEYGKCPHFCGKVT